MRRTLITIALGVTLAGHAQSVSVSAASTPVATASTPVASGVVVAEHITTLDPAVKAAARSVTLTGRLTRDHSSPGRRGSLNDDFRQLRDLCFRMERLDLSQAQVDTIPDCAFHSMHQLREVILPPTLRYIGHQAFYGCTSLQHVTFSGAQPAIAPYAFAATPFAHLSPVGETGALLPSDGVGQSADVARRASRRTSHRGQKGAGHIPPATTPFGHEVGPVVLPIPQRLTRLGGTFDKTASVSTRINPALPSEGYHLTARGSSIVIEGGDEAGIFYGRMTLDQLLRDADSRGCQPEAVDIVDAPRTPIRELMVDPARIFIPYDELKQFVVEMARYKLNTLHLHLVDDQAWRIEIKAYPQLTERSSSRVGMDDVLRPIEGHYTQQQMRDLCAFAARYHVTIVPEIELPGHEVAAIHALPWLTCGGAPQSEPWTPDSALPLRTTCGVSNELLCPSAETTYEFLETVLRELADVFPGPYVHLGGDEAGNPSLDCWTRCPSCQRLKAQLFERDGDSDAAVATAGRREGNWRLQQYMFDRVIGLLRDELGKTPMFWYETDFRQIQPGCITFAWRNGLTQAAIDAAKRCDAKIILCPGEHCYLDYPMGPGDMPEVNWGMPTTSLSQTYSLDPTWGNGRYTRADGSEGDFERDCLMGVAGTLWTECIPTPERLYYMAYPRALALAEVGWSPQECRSWPDFERRAAAVCRDMLARGVCADYKPEAPSATLR